MSGHAYLPSRLQSEFPDALNGEYHRVRQRALELLGDFDYVLYMDCLYRLEAAEAIAERQAGSSDCTNLLSQTEIDASAELDGAVQCDYPMPCDMVEMLKCVSIKTVKDGGISKDLRQAAVAMEYLDQAVTALDREAASVLILEAIASVDAKSESEVQAGKGRKPLWYTEALKKMCENILRSKPSYTVDNIFCDLADEECISPITSIESEGLNLINIKSSNHKTMPLKASSFSAGGFVNVGVKGK